MTKWMIFPTAISSALLILAAIADPVSSFYLAMAYFFGVPGLILITGVVLLVAQVRLRPRTRKSVVLGGVLVPFLIATGIYVATVLFVGYGLVFAAIASV